MAHRIAHNGELDLYAIDDNTGYVVNRNTKQKFDKHTIVSILSKGVWEFYDEPVEVTTVRVVTKGGPGSGHYGHSGRPGEQGGSLPDGVASDYELASYVMSLAKYVDLVHGVKFAVVDEIDNSDNITPSIPGTRVAGRYDPDKKKIEIASFNLNDKLNVNNVGFDFISTAKLGYPAVAIHEMAHVIDGGRDYWNFNTRRSNQREFLNLYKKVYSEATKGNTRKVVSKYSLTGASEFFAENFTVYKINPGWLKTNFPAMYDYMSKVDVGIENSKVSYHLKELHIGDEVEILLDNGQYVWVKKLDIAEKGGPGSGHFGHSGRRGKVGGSIPGKGFDGTVEETFGTWSAIETFADTDARVADIMNYVKDRLNKFKFNSLHGTVHTYEVNRIAASPEKTAEVQRVLEDTISKCRVCIRVKSDLLLNILEDGEIKNQFETKESGGILDNDWRARTENTYFGIDHEDRDPAHHPIYGYLANTLNGSKGNTNHYGDLIIELNENVADRTTVTGFDSLNQEEYSMPASPMREPSWKSFYDVERENLNVEVPSQAHREEYIEAQIHGGVDLYDIKKIWFPIKKYKEDIYTNAILRGYEPLVEEINNNFPMISTEIVMWEHESELDKIILRDR